MYRVLLVSRDRDFSAAAAMHIPHIDTGMTLRIETSVPAAAKVLRRDPLWDAVVVDHGPDSDAFSMLESIDRMGVRVPLVMVVSDISPQESAKAVNSRVDAMVVRDGSPSMGMMEEVHRAVTFAAERHRLEVERAVSETRARRQLELLSMRWNDTRAVIDRALDIAIDVTGSEIGYVGEFDRVTGTILMMGWSSSAMRMCGVGSYHVDFDLGTTGVWGDPIRTGRPVIMNGYQDSHARSKKGVPEGHVRLQRLLMVPIVIDGELVGTAGVANKHTDYTRFDEVQLTSVMESLFHVKSKVDAAMRRGAEYSAMKRLITTCPVGMAAVTQGLDVSMMNVAFAIQMGLNPDAPGRIDGDHILRTAIRDLMASIHDGGPPERSSLVCADNHDGRYFRVRVARSDNGEFLVTSSDVSESVGYSRRTENVLEHICVLEGPVLETLSRSVDAIAASPAGSDPDIAGQLSELSEAIGFMRDYRSIGIGDPEWMDLGEAVSEGAEAAGVRGVSAPSSVSVLADPYLHVAFKHLFLSSASRGVDPSGMSVTVGIAEGVLEIRYSDGCGAFADDVAEGASDTMFLVRSLVSASGFLFEVRGEGADRMLVIDVPPSSYTIG